jgi:Domain of Unknown Function (DUF1080)
MKLATLVAGLGLTLWTATPAWSIDYCDTEVRTVTPGSPSAGGLTPPSDAIALFDGQDLSAWKSTGGPAAWDVKDGVLTVKKGSGDIETKQSFHDMQLHIEWRIPKTATGEGQHRGNSGVFLLGRYEIQILDSYHNRTYADGQAGAVYGQVPPLVNAMRPPGEWNTYDIMFTAPRFYDDGTVLSRARVTVLHNGVLIQNNAEILGPTGAWGRPGYYEAQPSGPIRLQDHPGPGDPISFRNIWVRKINPATGLGAPAQTDFKVISRTTIGELIANPITRVVLSRCVPELVPGPFILDYVGKKTLDQLKGELDITLTDAKLRLIDEQLTRALAAPAESPH